MATNTAGGVGRQNHTQQVGFLRKNITYADNGKTLSMGWLPAGAVVIGAGVVVGTVFNGGSTNTVDIGTAADTDGLATALALGTVGVIPWDESATTNDAGPYSADTEMKCVVVSTANASTGVGVVFIQYLCDL